MPHVFHFGTSELFRSGTSVPVGQLNRFSDLELKSTLFNKQ